MESDSPSPERESRRPYRSPRQERVGRSPPWREIYREIRGKGIDSSDTETEESLSFQQALEREFCGNLSRNQTRPRSAETARVVSPRYGGDQSSSLPRGGVYSSPMPILRKDNSYKVCFGTIILPEMSLQAYGHLNRGLVLLK